MQECVRDGRAEAERIRAAKRLPRPQEPTVMIDWWGSEEAVLSNSWIGGAWRRIRGKQVVQRPTCEVGNEDTPQPNPEGSFRRRSAPAAASPVVESEGGMWLVCESSGPVGYELGVEVGMGALCVRRGNRGLNHTRTGQYVCVELVRVRDLDSWQRKRQLLDERSGGTEAPADELLRERLFGTAPGQRETREHVCLPAQERMPSRKIFEHSGWIVMTKDRGSRSGRKCVRRVVRSDRPTVPWRVLPRVSRCVNRCSTTEGTPSCGCTCG